MENGKTIQELAKLTKSELRGDPAVTIFRLQPLESAKQGDVTFFAPASAKRAAALKKTASGSSASAIVVKSYEPEFNMPQLISAEPMSVVIQLGKLLYTPPARQPGVHPTAVVDPSVRLGEDVSIGAYVVIGPDAEIGDRSTIHPHVVIYQGAKLGKECVLHAGSVVREFVKLGDDCLIQPGAVLGSDGFGYQKKAQETPLRIPQIGMVVLEDSVDVGANSTVDRATLGETRIRTGAKLDNLVMIGHNVQIGERSLLCAQVGVAGTSTVGKDCVFAGQAGVGDHVTIGDNVRAVAKCGMVQDIAANTDVGGYPAIKVTEWRRNVLLIRDLHRLFKGFRKYAKRFAQEQQPDKQG